MITRHLVITGRVQGVGYRAWLAKAAEKQGIYGWCRNRHDGSVEAVIHGAADKIETLITSARKGPILARVTNIAVSDTQTYEGPGSFETRADA